MALTVINPRVRKDTLKTHAAYHALVNACVCMGVLVVRPSFTIESYCSSRSSRRQDGDRIDE